MAAFSVPPVANTSSIMTTLSPGLTQHLFYIIKIILLNLYLIFTIL